MTTHRSRLAVAAGLVVTLGAWTGFAQAPPALPASAASTGGIVRLDSGLAEGVVRNGVLSLKGLPFAAPPVGGLRWRAPQPVAPWTGVRRATEYGPDCPQVPVAADMAAAGKTQAEDCLVLNVWKPAFVPAGTRLPVLVWIHGGGYVNGGSAAPAYDGSAFARQGIVFVSANYRLGRLGFFAHPALLAANEGPVGNFAYMDQIAALRWVQRNAAALSGDPGRVTVMGESAGGDSVMHLTTSPEARGLFHQAVVMSGDGRSHLLGGMKLTGGTALEPSADQVGVNFAQTVGIQGDGPDALQALRALPVEQVRGTLNMASLLERFQAVRSPLTHTGGAIVDGRIVVAEPGEVLRSGGAARIPIMIGTTAAEVPARLPPLNDPLSYFGGGAEAARALYETLGTLTPAELLIAIGADMTMHEPARFVARRMTAYGSPAWLYRFEYVPESERANVRAAMHASEVPFFFSTIDARYGTAATAADRAATRALHQYLVNFVRTGDPNGADLPAWPRVDPSASDLMRFGRDGVFASQPDPWHARLDLVAHAAEGAVP